MKILTEVKEFLIWLLTLPVLFYRKFISPFKRPCCKFYPTCSTYALQALRKYGIMKGSYLAVRRLLRCHPWSMGGIDYVP